ncbi:TonB-dependent receptor domain-containing protein [Eilatimonas milleporae]|uniref:Outer membrane receptor protein involved in Fe transport n=1 Tax=Eilatimonas milleporae TaxID=911205 RepID=A0A3M0CSM6_9PROT|nr:TonB-dependent receptor [Eilatimonas milleporae]RMB11875.1 outer membrane receptor protein involved in Fe transport [Eilatimonas milleporae]
MSKKSFFQRVKPVLAVAVSSLAICVSVPPTLAQSENQTQTQQEINIAARALSQSLLAISDAFNVDILAPNSLVAGKTAPSVSGAMDVDEALRRVLADSGLVATPAEDGAYVIARQETTPDRTPAPADGIDEKRVIETIIVTGTKQELSVQDTTISAEIFTADRIESEALFSLQDIIQRTPNISSVDGSVTNITIRGISRNGTDFAGQGQTSNIYLDGAPATETALDGFQSLWDVEQVEILRGPQSTLQGRNALAGAVFLQSANPTYEWDGKARARIAEFGTRQYSAAVSGPLLKGQLAFRISGDHQESDGLLTNAFTGEAQDSRESLSLRGKLLIEPAALDDLSVLLTLEYIDRESGSASIARAPVPVVDPAFADFDQTGPLTFDSTFANIRETYRAIADITYDINEAFKLRVIGTYEDANTETSFDVADGGGFTGSSVNNEFENVTYSGEARLEFEFGKLSGLIGGYYFRTDSTSDGLSNVPLSSQIPFQVSPADSILSINFLGQSKVENYSAFASVRYEPSARWTIDLGFRIDDENFTTQNDFQGIDIVPDTCLVTVPGSIVGAPLPVVTLNCIAAADFLTPPTEPQQGDNFTVFLPRAAVTYHFSGDHSVFVGARRGYRAGGPFLRIDQATGLFSVGTFDPEFLTSYEAGWRSVWLDGDLTFNGTVFLSKYQDQQISIPGPSGVPTDQVTVNAAESTLYGLELSANYEATENLSLYGSLGLLRTEFDEFPLSLASDAEADLSGNEFENAPNVSFSLGANYRHRSGFFSDVSLNYQGDAESTVFNFGSEDLGSDFTERVEDAAIVNARLGYRMDHFTLTVFATNLFDADQPTNILIANQNTAFGTTGDNRFLSRPGFTLRQPQTFGVSIDLEF